VEQQQLELHHLLQHMRSAALRAQEADAGTDGSSGGAEWAEQEQAGSGEEGGLDG
jgi:hypothetical protein